jgi:hypothetical protein
MSEIDSAQRRADFHAQTARIPFRELQRYFAGGHLVLVGKALDLVDVAVALAEDDKARFEAWIGDDSVGPVSDDQARTWLTDDAELWAVVANPWVLVQELVQKPSPEPAREESGT